MQNKKYISLLAIGLLAIGLAVAGPAFAKNEEGENRETGNNIQKSEVAGTVTAISGNTITLSAKNKPAPNTNGSSTQSNAVVLYTVDATNAKVIKDNATSTVSAIAVGDTLIVQGTITGTNIVATTIRDGVEKPQVQGNGQPIVAGKITAISGKTITITNSSNVTYTVDATSAKFVVPGVKTPTITNVAVGDNVIVQGTVSGNSVVASSIIDQKAKNSNAINNPGNGPKPKGFFGGMMGGIGNFFKRLFGF